MFNSVAKTDVRQRFFSKDVTYCSQDSWKKLWWKFHKEKCYHEFAVILAPQQKMWQRCSLLSKVEEGASPPTALLFRSEIVNIAHVYRSRHKNVLIFYTAGKPGLCITLLSLSRTCLRYLKYDISSRPWFIEFSQRDRMHPYSSTHVQPGPQGGNQAISPSKFSKTCLFVRYNNKVQSFPPLEMSAGCGPWHCIR